jgi:predicted transcriptional regulator
MAGKPTPLRIDDATLARLDRLAEAMTKRTGGIRVPRTGVIREAMNRGIEALELELDLPSRRKPKR